MGKGKAVIAGARITGRAAKATFTAARSYLSSAMSSKLGKVVVIGGKLIAADAIVDYVVDDLIGIGEGEDVANATAKKVAAKVAQLQDVRNRISSTTNPSELNELRDMDSRIQDELALLAGYTLTKGSTDHTAVVPFEGQHGSHAPVTFDPDHNGQYSPQEYLMLHATVEKLSSLLGLSRASTVEAVDLIKRLAAVDADALRAAVLVGC